MYLVLGYDEYEGNRIILMTQKTFDSYDVAQTYANSCGKVWCAFVVKVMDKN